MEGWFVLADDVMQQPTIQVASPEVQVAPPIVQGVVVIPKLKLKSCHKGTRRGRKKGSGMVLSLRDIQKFKSEIVETWIDVEDNKDIIDSIVDDELLRLDKTEEILVSIGDEEEYEKVVVERRSLKRKISHLDATEALSTLKNYIEANSMDGNCKKSLSRLRWEIQKNCQAQPKKSPSLNAFLQLHKRKYKA